jgi:hypothetical protein
LSVQVWGVGGKFGTSAAVGVVLPPAPQMVEKQGWSYVSRPNHLLRGAHEPQNDITSIAFSKVSVTARSDFFSLARLQVKDRAKACNGWLMEQAYSLYLA